MQVFIAGPLHIRGLRKLELYESIARLCEHSGLKAFIPHLHTEPIDKPVDPKVVFEQDFEGLSASDLLIAEVTSPSHGVGCELMQAYIQRIPIICIMERGAKVSRMVRGNPYVKALIEYDNEEHCLQILREYLINRVPYISSGKSL